MAFDGTSSKKGKETDVPFCMEIPDHVTDFSEFLATDPEVRVLFPELLDFMKSSGIGTASTQPREYN
jgi:hypothetical protein